MKRSGFTMIELIFVIVILGILAAVALPKFIGVSEQAQVGKLKGYVGSLNRTVAPALWSKSISNNDKGSMKPAANTTKYNGDLNTTLSPLENIQDDGTSFGTVALESCSASTTAVATDANIIATGAVATGTIGGKTYSVRCVDGNMSSAPRFFLDDGTTVLVK